MLYLKSYESFAINHTDEPFHLSSGGLVIYASQEFVDKFKTEENRDTIHTNLKLCPKNDRCLISIYFRKGRSENNLGQEWFYWNYGTSGDYGFNHSYYKPLGKRIARDINQQIIEKAYPFCKKIPNFFKLMMDTKTTKAIPFTKIVNDNLQLVIDYYLRNPSEINTIPEFLKSDKYIMTLFNDIKKQIDWS
jgi:hypothetical protein